MKELSSVLVTIVTWNKQKYVIDLLNSLRKLNYNSDNLDVVVVDNASTDDTVSILKRDFPYVHLIENTENLGGTGGFNSGLAYAFKQPEEKYDYIWLLDNDVVVHPNALKELVDVLEGNPDVGLAGSTMLQLTDPTRINEMGAFVDLGRGTLFLNRHKKKVSGLQGRTIEELQNSKIDLSDHLEHCNSDMSVDYVAAASLVIRTSVAKKAGLWDDYFIHYDDVEWCLRIAKMGHRIVVSARSVIWHLPAEYKVPTWVLYYDNRNVLYLLKKHSGEGIIPGVRSWIKKKCLYYALLGKEDISKLHLKALTDYDKGVMGKGDIDLDDCYCTTEQIQDIFEDRSIKRALLPWTVNLQSSHMQLALMKAMNSRPDLQIDYLVPPPSIEDALPRQLPGAGVVQVPSGKIRRLLNYIKQRNKYDLVLQSDYQAMLPLNLLARRILYINYEGISLRKRPTIKGLIELLKILKRT